MADVFQTTALADAAATLWSAGEKPCTEFEAVNDLSSAGSAAIHVEGFHPTDVYEVLAPGESKAWKAPRIICVTGKRYVAGTAATVRWGPTSYR